jgi:hypothetical protein
LSRPPRKSDFPDSAIIVFNFAPKGLGTEPSSH